MKVLDVQILTHYKHGDLLINGETRRREHSMLESCEKVVVNSPQISVYLISKGSVGTLSYSLVVQCDWFRKSEKTCILRVYNISSSARVKL